MKRAERDARKADGNKIRRSSCSGACVSAERRRRRIRSLQLLYPESDPETLERQMAKKTRILLCAAAALLCLMLARCFIDYRQDRTDYSVLIRPEPGAAAKLQTVEVRLDESGYTVPLLVQSRTATEEECRERLDAAEQEMIAALGGPGSSQEGLCSPLNLDHVCADPEVEAYWYDWDDAVIRPDGTAAPDSFDSGRPCQTQLKLYLEYAGTERLKTVQVTLLPAAELLTKEGMLQRDLQEAVNAAALADPTGEQIRLPERIGERALTYGRKGIGGTLILLLSMGLGGCAAIWYLPEQQLKEAEQKRREELELTYPEITAKLAILLGAGMSLRSAWQKLCMDYQKERERGGPRKAAYEEMRCAEHRMRNGENEVRAYLSFGQRTGVFAYRRLASLLVSDRKNGRRELVDSLNQEAEAAYTARMEYARKQGEKISDRLLLPLILLLMQVLLLVMVPAFMSW